MLWLKRLFAPLRNRSQPKRFDGHYRVFTQAHDQEIHFIDSETLRAHIEVVSHYTPPDFAAYLETSAATYEDAAHQLLGQLAGARGGNIAVTLLLDHSGSLRGEPSCLQAALTGIYSEFLSRLGIGHEVLAFTTSSWRGGRSYKDWIAAGSPPAPGRLCDLLHIVYHTADRREPIGYEALVEMTNPWLLKENIDGEALLWARNRLALIDASRRVLIIVSDGAPVDDATLLANGPNILEDHVRAVSRETIQDGGVELYAIGLGHTMGRYYPQYATVLNSADIGAVALPVLAAILASDAHAPSIAQASLPP